MSHIAVRKLAHESHGYAGRTWHYSFKRIPKECVEADVQKISQSLAKRASAITKQWDSTKNDEWISRVYFSAKMILNASVLAQGLEYAIEKNLRPVRSYLEYYSVLSTLRAIVLTDPSVNWDDGRLLESNHSKIINSATETLKRFNKKSGENSHSHILGLKAFREMISYRAPSSGDSVLAKTGPLPDVIQLCRFCAEVAQLQSEVFEASVLKNTKERFDLSFEAINKICRVEIDGVKFHDDEDEYRMGYLRRKHSIPTNILFVMSEGHVEDFFGSWCAEDKADGQFDPDENWRIIFDVP